MSSFPTPTKPIVLALALGATLSSPAFAAVQTFYFSGQVRATNSFEGVPDLTPFTGYYEVEDTTPDTEGAADLGQYATGTYFVDFGPTYGTILSNPGGTTVRDNAAGFGGSSEDSFVMRGDTGTSVQDTSFTNPINFAASNLLLRTSQFGGGDPTILNSDALGAAAAVATTDTWEEALITYQMPAAGGANPAGCGAFSTQCFLSLEITTIQAEPFEPALAATKADALFVDADSNGQVGAGDTLRYTVTLSNTGTGSANAVLFTDTPDANTTLISGSVTTSQGSVTSGNTGGDTNVAVDVGTLAASASATITFDVTINGFTPGVTQISNQGSFTATELAQPLLTDDPDVGGSADPTVTLLDAIAEIPTLSPLALVLLGGGLAGVSALAVRRRRKDASAG